MVAIIYPSYFVALFLLFLWRLSINFAHVNPSRSVCYSSARKVLFFNVPLCGGLFHPHLHIQHPYKTAFRSLWPGNIFKAFSSNCNLQCICIELLWQAFEWKTGLFRWKYSWFWTQQGEFELLVERWLCAIKRSVPKNKTWVISASCFDFLIRVTRFPGILFNSRRYHVRRYEAFVTECNTALHGIMFCYD